jgi:hypothetical protein
MTADRRYLELKNGKWRVVVLVPRKLRGAIGTAHLRKYLGTDSLAIANRLKWPVVAEFKKAIADTAAANGNHPCHLETALAIARARRDADDLIHLNDLDYEQAVTGERIADPVTQRTFIEVASGDSTPVDHLHPQYLEAIDVKMRTRRDSERAMRFLLEWCKRSGTRPTLQAITKKIAVRFMDELHTVAGAKHTVTLEKYIYRLSRYWHWLERRDDVEFNGTPLRPQEGRLQRA